jgi:uncharacterized protein (DUF924 family)
VRLCVDHAHFGRYPVRSRIVGRQVAKLFAKFIEDDDK